MYKRILLAVDGSENANRAATEAAKIASLTGGSMITVVFVADFDKAKSEVLHTKGKEDLNLARKKKIQPAIDQIEKYNVAYEVEILHGEPGPSIIKHANSGEFDMAVLGSRGLNVFQEMVLGSVSHKAVKRIDCPVLIVK